MCGTLSNIVDMDDIECLPDVDPHLGIDNPTGRRVDQLL
jgi:hypothetical protein